MADRITVIILTFNQRDTTLRCIESLKADEGLPFDILVWDNGSSDGTIEALRARFPDVVSHYSESNLGVASGRNAAAKLADEQLRPTHVLFLDNDINVEPGFVRSLYEPFGSDPKIGQTQAKLRFADDPERLNDGGGCDINFVLGRTRPVGFGEIDRGQYDRQRPCVSCGGAMMVRMKLFQQLGGFDTSFDPFGPEDLDFSLRLAKAGWTAMFVPSAVGYHAVSHTFGAGYSPEYARHKTRHWILFMSRHAPRWKIAVFYSVTAPLLFLRAFFREAARGNPSASLGHLKGVVDKWRGTDGEGPTKKSIPKT